MKHVQLGETGIQVSAIALGTWAFSGDSTWGPQAEQDSIDTVHAALDRGINFLDTAPLYGDGIAETIIGKALKQKPCEVAIATKAGPDDLSPGALRKACEKSLSLLQREAIDLYQVHWPNRSVPFADTIETLAALKAEGKIRSVGVCNFGPGDMAGWRNAGGEMTANQLPYSLLWRALEFEIQPDCLAHDTGILCYSPLFNGLLTGKYANPDAVPEGKARPRIFSRDRPQARHQEAGCEAEAFQALDRIRTISEGLGESMVTTSLAWLMGRPGVLSVLAGARNPAQLEDQIRAAEVNLSEPVQAALSEATEQVKAILGANVDMWQTDSRFR